MVRILGASRGEAQPDHVVKRATTARHAIPTIARCHANVLAHLVVPKGCIRLPLIHENGIYKDLEQGIAGQDIAEALARHQGRGAPSKDDVIIQ